MTVRPISQPNLLYPDDDDERDEVPPRNRELSDKRLMTRQTRAISKTNRLIISYASEERRHVKLHRALTLLRLHHDRVLLEER